MSTESSRAVQSAGARNGPAAILAGMRPKQWLKNVLVFAAPLAAGSLFEPSVLLPSIGAFVAFFAGVIACVAVAVLPVRRALRLAITDCLRHT